TNPTFEPSLRFVRIYAFEYFEKSFEHRVFGMLNIGNITSANAQHFGRIKVIEFLLGNSIMLFQFGQKLFHVRLSMYKNCLQTYCFLFIRRLEFEKSCSR